MEGWTGVLAQVPGTALTRATPDWLLWLMPFVASTLLASLAFFVLKRGQPVIYNRVFFVLYVASAFKSLTDGLYTLMGPPGAGPLQDLVGFLNRITGYLYVTIFLWFVLVFPRPIAPWFREGRRGAVTLVLSAPFVLNELLYAFGAPIVAGVELFVYFSIYASILTLAALGLLVYHAWETDSEEEQHRLRLLAFVFFLTVASTVTITAIQAQALRASLGGAPQATVADYIALANFFVLVVAPVLEVVGSVLLTYAILRWQLLGIDLFVQRVTRASILTVSVGSLFIIISNLVEELFQNIVLGDLPLGFVVAGFVAAAAMWPFHKQIQKAVAKWFPDARGAGPEALKQRRMEIYEAQLRYAFLDGTLKEKELAMLHALRESLGLPSDEIRTVAGKIPGVPVERLLAAAGPSKARSA